MASGKFFFCLSLGILILPGCTGEGGPSVISAKGLKFEKTPRSWLETARDSVIIQSYDYSCGAGSLATLIRYYFGDDVSEKEILERILSGLSEEELADRVKNGLSMLDLKDVAEKMGYQAVGVRLKAIALLKLRGPVLVHVKRDGYDHFAVFKGVREDRVYLADPSHGNLRMSIEKFLNEWTGVALVLGKAGFGLPEEYPLSIRDESPVRSEVESARRALYR